MKLTDILICPLCGASLTRAPEEPGTLRCGEGHAYDLSRAGYVNLLPPGRGRNKKTGDERAMIRARAAFLRRGFYDPLERAVRDLLKDSLPDASESGVTVLCDMGAGEGTHTVKIAAGLSEASGRGVLALGFDASKHGAESGCRYARSLGLLIDADGEHPGDGSARVVCLPANLFHLPVRSGCADAALSLFAPIAWEEAARILKPDGVFLAVSSGQEHLLALRQVLYDEVRLTDFRPEPPDGAPFALLNRIPLEFPLVLEGQEDIQNLFTMTPFFHRAPESGRERLAALESLTDTARMELSLWRRLPVEAPSGDRPSEETPDEEA